MVEESPIPAKDRPPARVGGLQAAEWGTGPARAPLASGPGKTADARSSPPHAPDRAHPMTRPITSGTPALLALLALACASGPRGAEARIESIQSLTRDGDYVRAARASVQLLDELDQSSALRPQVVALQAEISVASGLETVRQMVFDGREVEALPVVEELKAAHPDVEAIDAWMERVRTKIADGWFEKARVAVAEERFDDARRAYAKSVEFDPTRIVVQNLLTELDRVEVWRAEVAEEVYFSGVGHLVDGRLLEAAGDFGKVGKYREQPTRARQRVSEVNVLLAQARVASAAALVADGHFSAAAKEFEEAARLNPNSDRIAADLERMRAEARANQMLIEGRSMILRGELERGAVELTAGLELTELQKDVFQKELDGIGERRVQAAYDRALGLEHDFRFEQAVTAYEAILESRDFFKDCRARIDVLEDKIAEAERLHAEAAQAEDEATELSLLRQIEVFWPDYSDIPDRIRALTKKSDE